MILQNLLKGQGTRDLKGEWNEMKCFNMLFEKKKKFFLIKN